MHDDRRSPTGRLGQPRALLLDFGGVVVRTKRNPEWISELAAHVHGLLIAAGAASRANPDLERIAEDIAMADQADSHWKNAMSRVHAPRELGYEEYWGDFVAADWPQAERAVVVREARELCRLMGHMKSRRTVRAGMPEVLDFCDRAKIPVGIVSNALCGQVHLEFLAAHGLASRFAVEVHSDVVGLRKPNAEMIHIAARRLGLTAADCWYVGDNYDRDVLCGIRAGVNGNILMEANSTYDLPYDLRVRPGAVVKDPFGLLELLERALAPAPA